MKVQIVGVFYTNTYAKVRVKLPREVNATAEIALPTHKVLTKKELVAAIGDELDALGRMRKRVQVVHDLMFQDIDIPSTSS